MITLYHGSNVAITEIDLEKGLPDKDFGKGFYLTDILEQAEGMAQRRTRIVGAGEPIVTAFAFDNLDIDMQLKVKIFPDEPCEEWAAFVNANRHSSETGFFHPYDVVIGPVANDGVAYQLERYNEGAIDLKTLTQELSYRKLNRQYFFGTKRAIEKLKRL
jgi:hypothetical protein